MGVGITPVPELTLAIDATWKQWSKWETSLALKPDPRFEDTWQVRTGVEVRLPLELELLPWIAIRSGYYVEPTPTPDQRGPTNLLDADKHVISFGIGWGFHDPFEMTPGELSMHAGFQAHLLEDRRTENDLDEVFGPIEAGGELYGGTLTLQVDF